MNPTASFPLIISRIIKEQELVIGPLAWEEARKVSGLQIIDEKKGEVNLQNGDPKNTVDKLVAQYERIFGRASHEVCKESVRDLIAQMPAEEVPASLK
jgi:hypothetical protein